MIFLALFLAFVGEQCGLCHPDSKVSFQASVHSREQVACVDCHGGNPEAITVEAAHRGQFENWRNRRTVPGLCAKCHANSRIMQPYNLPTDQYALYQTSQHGQLLGRGDTRVAVCTDCHGAHEIRRDTDPLSQTFQKNIPQTCGHCHGDPELMARYGKDGSTYEDYLNSRHAEELLQKGNTNAPECANCHGVHGAAPPGFGDVDKVCGTCHQAVREAFLEGPHAAALVAAEMPLCVSCHGNHSIATASGTSPELVCLKCHQEGSEQVELSRKFEVLFQRAEEEVEKARVEIELAEQVPLYVDDYLSRLQEARTHLLEAQPAFHSVRLENVERYTRAARSLGEEIQAEIQGEFGDLRLRRLLLLLFWFFLILTIAILYRFRQRDFSRP